MAPRLDIIKSLSGLSLSSGSAVPAPFLVPFLHQQRAASVLSSLSDTSGAYNKRIRRGRGPASGKGKTAGRGHKGQKQHGKVPAGFNGGQTPDHIVAGPRGFVNQTAIELVPLNLDRVQEWIDQGRLDPSKPITLKELTTSRCIHRPKEGIKLLARGAGELNTPINIVVSRASATAINTIESAGGTVTTRYYTPSSIRRILLGQSHPFASLLSSPDLMPATAETPAQFQYRLPDPTSRKDIEYYRDPAHRGYLRHQLSEGQSPSLFFKPAKGSRSEEGKVKATKDKPKEADNRIW